jgi:hypothetical protein
MLWNLATQFKVTSAETDLALHKKIILCQFIMGKFPDKGIDELMAAAENISEFHSSTGDEETPTTHKASARIGKTYTRPDFPIVGDDDDLLIDERIETKPKAVYKAKIRIHGYRRAEPRLPIGDDIELDLLDE